MANDVLMLGGITFDDFSTPAHIPFGGRQAMAVHKLPGGSRVIDTLGPDDADITWHGRFWSDSAMSNALQLDAMRAAGTPMPLSFGGQAWIVVISEFCAQIERFPQDVLYSITCVISSSGYGSGSGGFSAGAGIGSLISADLNAAAAL